MHSDHEIAHDIFLHATIFLFFRVLSTKSLQSDIDLTADVKASLIFLRKMNRSIVMIGTGYNIIKLFESVLKGG